MTLTFGCGDDGGAGRDDGFTTAEDTLTTGNNDEASTTVGTDDADTGDTTTTTTGDGDTGESTGDTTGDGDTGDATDTGESTDTTTTGDGDTSTDDGSTTGEVMPCDVPEANLAPATPQVMLVLDKSGSMLTTWDHDNNGGTPEITRWNSLYNVVDFIITNFDAQMDFGAMLFPSTQAVSVYSELACVTSNQPEVPVGPDGQAVLDGIPGPGDNSLAGGTPGEDAVDVSGMHLNGLDPDLPKAIIYISDGAANCGDAAMDNAGLFEDYDDKLPQTIGNLWANDEIPTYVVGIDISTEQSSGQTDGAPDLIVPWCKMDELGEVGGKPKDEAPGMACQEANTNNQDFYQAQNQIELQDALEAIVEDAISCKVNLDPVPNFPDLIEVEVDGMSVPMVADCENEDGWVYTDDTFESIELCGSWCDELKITGQADVLYFCNPG